MARASFGWIFAGMVLVASRPVPAQISVQPVSASDPFASSEWAADFFYSERGIVLDEDLDPEQVNSVPLRAIQVGYGEVHGDNTTLLLWRETAGDPTGEVTIEVGDVAVGSVPGLPVGARPDFNLALVSGLPENLAASPTSVFRVRRAGAEVGTAEQSVIVNYPMGTEFTPECSQISDPANLCALEICWTNPGPPTSGFELSVSGLFQLYREENLPGELNVEEVPIEFQGEYAVRVTPIIVSDDPDVTPFASDSEGGFFTPVGSFRGPAREITCTTTCGTTPPPRFRRGVCGGAGEAPQIADVLTQLGYLFLDEPSPPCLAACDSNGDHTIDIGDALFTLLYLFAGGSPPPGWVDRTGDGVADSTCERLSGGDSCDTPPSSCEA